MARAADTPVAPFGATRTGVAALTPEARIFPGDGPLPAGQYGVTEAQVDAWLDELSGAVAMRLDGWERLTTVVPAEAPAGALSDRDQFVEFARTLVHNGTASYLEAARFPERATGNTSSYAAVLWDRYTTGLNTLAEWLTARLATGDPEDTPAVESGGIGYSFPDPLFADDLRF